MLESRFVESGRGEANLPRVAPKKGKNDFEKILSSECLQVICKGRARKEVCLRAINEKTLNIKVILRRI